MVWVWCGYGVGVVWVRFVVSVVQVFLSRVLGVGVCAVNVVVIVVWLVCGWYCVMRAMWF